MLFPEKHIRKIGHPVTFSSVYLLVALSINVICIAVNLTVANARGANSRVNAGYIRRIDRPNARYDVKDVIEKLKNMPVRPIIQTMFMKGEFEGLSVDNTTDEYVDPWIDALEEIKPREVMIYTLDRDTPAAGLKKAEKEALCKIRDKLENRGFSVMVSV